MRDMNGDDISKVLYLVIDKWHVFRSRDIHMYGFDLFIMLFTIETSQKPVNVICVWPHTKRFHLYKNGISFSSNTVDLLETARVNLPIESLSEEDRP